MAYFKFNFILLYFLFCFGFLIFATWIGFLYFLVNIPLVEIIRTSFLGFNYLEWKL